MLSEKTSNLDMSFELAKEMALHAPFKVMLSPSENGGLKVSRKALFLPSVYYVLIDETPKGALISIRANKTEKIISVVFSVLVCAAAGGGVVASILRVFHDGDFERALVGILMVFAAALIFLWLKFIFLILRAISRTSAILNYFQGKAG